MRLGKFTDLIETIPDELFDWVHQIHDDVLFNYNMIVNDAILMAHIADSHSGLQTRADKAAWINKNAARPGLTFAALDGKLFSSNTMDKIWRMVKPAYSRPVSTTED